MRGKRNKVKQRGGNLGITPADAGKTQTQPNYLERKKDHPRGCGENKFLLVGLSEIMGSPPRMRGKRRQHMCYLSSRRITPADAGKTPLIMLAPVLHMDHPRGCGENKIRQRKLPSCLGSPPRMRGKPTFRTFYGRRLRITPADAGKTVLHMTARLKFQDHPRGCGENRIPSAISAKVLGSPPRMRGKLLYPLSSINCNGITPADAGKTCNFRWSYFGRWDHPRGCGENFWTSRFIISSMGITPADAGKTKRQIISEALT